MRIPKYISPSSLSKFEKDREGFFFNYCSEPRPDREPQSKPASVGSAFDACVKSRLMSDVFGESSFSELFEAQVEKQNRDFALTAGRHVMENYVASGAYNDLLELIENAKEEPKFEFNAKTDVNGIPILGKPDCRFIHKDGAHIILDWKVNGYCGKSSTSPHKGYMLCRDGLNWKKPSQSNGTSHKFFKPFEFLGLTVNEFFMEQISIDWADQLSMYAWMLGEPVGSEEMVVCIEQIVAKAAPLAPLLRIANHRARVSKTYQCELEIRLDKMWAALNNRHIFNDLNMYENNLKIEELTKRAYSMISDGTNENNFFARCASKKHKYQGR